MVSRDKTIVCVLFAVATLPFMKSFTSDIKRFDKGTEGQASAGLPVVYKVHYRIPMIKLCP